MPGDIDLDGDVDVDDIDSYADSLNGGSAGILELMDLDGDFRITIEDHNLLVNTLVETTNGVGTLLGDTNLDGTVDVLADAFVLISNLGNADTDWSTGDFNADNQTDVLGDAFLLISNLGN